MLNPLPLNVQLYCAIRNKGYTTTDQTYEVVEAVLGVLSQQTPATQTIESVHAPYDPIAILKRNVAELELALKRQTERAEKAEEKLTTARDDMQSWIDSRNGWMERAGAAEAELAKMRELPNVPIDAEAFEIHRMNRLIAADPKMNAPCCNPLR